MLLISSNLAISNKVCLSLPDFGVMQPFRFNDMTWFCSYVAVRQTASLALLFTRALHFSHQHCALVGA